MSAPTPAEIRAVLEGYGISTAVLTDAWITSCRDEEIIPHVEDVTRMVFTGESSITEYYSGNGNSVLILNRRPVVSITTIRDVSAITQVNLSGAVELIENEGIIKARSSYSEGVLGPVFRKGDKNIVITYVYGFDDYPDRVKRAIKNMVAAKILVTIGTRTGGGDLSVQAHGRAYGTHGKYTDIRKELVHSAYGLLRKYITGVTGS